MDPENLPAEDRKWRAGLLFHLVSKHSEKIINPTCADINLWIGGSKFPYSTFCEYFASDIDF